MQNQTPPPPTTTIADLKAQGFTHLTIRCRCKTVDLPFGMLRVNHREVTLAELERRLRCDDCLHAPEPGSLRGWKQSDAPGYATSRLSGPPVW